MAGPPIRLRALVLLAFAVLVCGRMPGIVWYGRMWAEEGLFYQNAWTMPPLQALFLQYGGYLNLVANAASVLARYAVPLADAPIVLTGIAFLFQLCPAILLVTSQASWLRSPLAMAAAVFFLATSALGEEVFLQTLHSQYHLLLCTALILALMDRPGPALRWFRRALLLLAPLCGMLPVVLVPLFVARTLLDRTQERAIQCATLSVGAALQVGLFYSPAGGAALGRAATVWPGLLLETIALRQVLTPLLGLDAGLAVGGAIRSRMLSQGTPLWPVFVLVAAVGGMGWLALRQRRSGAVWMLVSALLLAGVSYYGAIGGGLQLLDPDFGQRYAFVPDVLMLWTLLCLAATAPWHIPSRLAGAFAIWIMAASAVAWPRSLVNQAAVGPNWRREVARWKADPSHAIRIWPYGWTMQLDPDHRPTPSASRTYVVIEPD